MALENVDATSLKNELNKCLNSINYTTTENYSTNISNSIWEGASKSTFQAALKELVNIRYKELKDKINKYINETDKIVEYQNAASSNNNLISQRNSKQTELNKEKLKTDKDQSKITRLQNEINSLNAQIIANQNSMSSIENSL